MPHGTDTRARSEHEQIHQLFIELLTQPQHNFPPRGVGIDAPIIPGVYIVRDKNKRVSHVGETPRAKYGLWQRLTNHVNGQSTFVKHHLNMDTQRLRENYTYQYLTVQDARTRALLECYAAGVLCPLHIHTSIDPDIKEMTI